MNRVRGPLFRYPNTMGPILYIGRHQSAIGDPAGMLPHSHPRGFEIIFVERGDIEWWTGENVHELKPDDILVTPPHVPHGGVDSALSPCEYIWIHLDPNSLPENLRSALSGPGFSGVHRSCQEIGALMSKLLEEHIVRDNLSSSVCQSMAEMLVVSLSRTAGRKREPKMSKLVIDAQKALLEEEFGPRSVEMVADRLAVSCVWLTKKFRKEVGQAPAAWLRSWKIAEAKRLLGMGNESVAEIAVSLGFGSSQYFATAFRRETGRTPSEYRRLHPGSATRH